MVPTDEGAVFVGDLSLLLALGLGLLGFVEPCTIGAHMLFLSAQKSRAMAARLRAVMIFILARVAVMAGFGGLIVVLGQRLIGLQTGAWLGFGLLYLAIGMAIYLGADGVLRQRIALAPARWKSAQSPLVQGLGFGLNIPACAAPILFALIGSATLGGTVATGFLMMAIFALALSLPLVPLSVMPGLARPLDRLGDWLRPRRRFLGLIFLLLGVWSVYFGLFVDPADWSSL